MHASEESDFDEIEAVWLVEPYVNELPAHLNDDDKDDEEDSDVLRTWFEREVPVNEWNGW